MLLGFPSEGKDLFIKLYRAGKYIFLWKLYLWNQRLRSKDKLESNVSLPFNWIACKPSQKIRIDLRSPKRKKNRLCTLFVSTITIPLLNNSTQLKFCYNLELFTCEEWLLITKPESVKNKNPHWIFFMLTFRLLDLYFVSNTWYLFRYSS